ncbi:MCP four helix bundle domain-containing protein, partial [Arthrospira platensis SPKY1]|nr:MCP four helix bundle domain-containing protein [Arthrospira platensis SPKY1]
LVFVIVLMTNLIDKDNFSKLRYSIVTIYEDRIVASDLIFEIALMIQEKEIAAAISDSSFFNEKNEQVNQRIQELIERYGQTKLTREEREIFNDLKDNLKNLEKLEEEFISSGLKSNVDLFYSIKDIVYNLYDL